MLYASGEGFTLYQGDNRIVLKELADESVDSVVTDPPYELGFMGKSWDASGVAYDVELWREVLRVLKSGGHLLAFSGSRTYHRMAVAIENAGFDIRDQIMWIYGSGFPKSLDVSKAIDKAAGAQRQVVGSRPLIGNGKTMKSGFHQPDGSGAGETIKEEIYEFTAPATTEAKQWQGWGTALKPAHEPVVLARKPLIGTVAENVLTYGTGGLNIDGGRVGSEGGTKASEFFPDTQTVTAYGNGLNGNKKPIELNVGRWPANVIHDGSDEVVELFPRAKGGAYPAVRGKSDIGAFALGGNHKDKPNQARVMGDDGSAARFFYCAKASKKDRNEGLDGFEAIRIHDGRTEGTVGGSNPRNRTNNYRQNHHPTVKPTTLMEYLCKLVTPPNGIVLDPFMGSGSTGKAAMYAGFNFIGIEMTEEYLPIAKARIEFAVNNREETLFDA